MEHKIKFRLIKDGKIVGYEHHILCLGGIQIVNSSIIHDRKDRYLGLIDKNNKETYENDIIEWEYPNPICVFRARIVYGDITFKGDLDDDIKYVGFYCVFDDGTKAKLPRDGEFTIIGCLHKNKWNENLVSL